MLGANERQVRCTLNAENCFAIFREPILLYLPSMIKSKILLAVDAKKLSIAKKVEPARLAKELKRIIRKGTYKLTQLGSHNKPIILGKSI
jgi:hypothetical protein